MAATLSRSHLDNPHVSQSTRAAVTGRWHEMRRLTGLIAVVLSVTSGLVLSWPAMAVISVLGLGLVVDSILALRTERVATGPTLDRKSVV